MFRLPHSLQAPKPCSLSYQHPSPPSQRPLSKLHTYTHIHSLTQRRIKRNISHISSRLYLLSHLLLHLLPGGFGLQSPARLWPAGQLTLAVFMLGDALFIQVSDFTRRRGGLHVEIPQLSLFHSTEFQTNISLFPEKPQNKVTTDIKHMLLRCFPHCSEKKNRVKTLLQSLIECFELTTEVQE